MKVAHRDDYDTHAVIGGKEIQEFGIAQTAEFFTVLSNTLYSNKPLAVIREVLCNAWDAHIVSGRTDKPVIVTIDEDKLSIRDFGPGIPHKLIHQIYCVYGTSTKENDGNQTGGFGLGSKSPFAYSDHFTVVNHHDGHKTVHAISRGSALTQGKPDRRVMVVVPSDETGVEVIIPVKNRGDRNLFIEITKDIAAFGEMNVVLNDLPVEVVPISSGENNMFLTTRKPRGSYASINIRYGNVIYPVLPEVEYVGVYQKLKKILDDIPSKNHGGNEFCLIIQAPANSISVTPSRESLSNTETTVKTLRVLFSQLVEHMAVGTQMFESLLRAEQEKAMTHLIKGGYAERILFSENLLTDQFGPKSLTDQRDKPIIQITSMVGLADYYLRYKTRLGDNLKLNLQHARVNRLIEDGYRRISDLKVYRSIYTKKDSLLKRAAIFRKGVMRPLVKRMVRDEVVDHKNLFVVQPQHNKNLQRHAWQAYCKYEADPTQFLAMLTGVVIVTHNRVAFEEDWDNCCRDIKDNIPNKMLRLVYVSPRTKGHRQAAVEFFTKLGYRVIDFAAILDAHRATTNAMPAAKSRYTNYSAPAKPRNMGLVLLSSNVSANAFSPVAHTIEGKPRSTSYEYVIKPDALSDKFQRRFFPWGDDMATSVVSLFGSNIGICINDPQLESQKEKGKKDALAWIAQTIVDKVLTSPAIRSYVENKLGVKNATSLFTYLLDMANHSTVLLKAFGLPKEVPEDDLNYFRVFEVMCKSVAYSHMIYKDGSWQQIVYEAKEVIKTWTPAPAFTALAERVNKSRGLQFLDIYNIRTELKRLDKINPDYPLKIFLETSVLNALNL